MLDHTSLHELLLRGLDGRLTDEQRRRVAEGLRTQPEAREFLRTVAEHSVMIADLERMARERQPEPWPRPSPAPGLRAPIVPVRVRPWRRALAAAAAVAVLAVAASQWLPYGKPWVARVAKVTGASQCFGSRGAVTEVLDPGLRLGAGDTLETRSCDAWIELELRGGSRLTMGGHSTLRILEGASDEVGLKLVGGTLWFSPARAPGGKALRVDTPTVDLNAQDAQFDLQTSASETVLRVNAGTVRVRHHLGGRGASVPAGSQMQASLAGRAPLVVATQPAAVARWTCDLAGAPRVTLGRWLPPSEAQGARLGAQPLLWPLPKREPVLLYAVALSVASSTDRPVLLEVGSRLRFRGRTARPQTVRFGFSTQKMRGVFAGKFEVDVKPERLGPPGQTWEVTLPLSEFRPLQPQLSFSPGGLELTDVYALTVQQDAGLELNHVELAPAELGRSPIRP